MTFAQIRKLYLQAVEDTPIAREEAWVHIGEGQRRVATHQLVQIPETMSIDESVAVSADTDYVLVSAIADKVYAISSVFNVTNGYLMYPEPSGMDGRMRYLEKTTGLPPAGEPTHYERDGARLYVRNMPEVETILKVRAHRQLPSLSDSDLNDNPIVPEQFHMAIVHAAAASYWALHPRQMEDGRPMNLSAQQSQEVERIIASVKPPKAEEDRMRGRSFRLRGYSLRPRSR